MKAKAFTLIEMVVATAVFLATMVLGGSLFVLGQRFYGVASAQADVGVSAIQGISRLQQELEESDQTGIGISTTPPAIVFVSARNSAAAFQMSSSGASAGQPIWTKWICYYLVSQSGSSWSTLVRKEGNPAFSTLPVTGNPPPVPPASSTWLTQFTSLNAKTTVVARDVKSLSFITGNPMYIQLTSESDYGGVPAIFNPGFTNGSCCWVQVKINN